MEENYVVSCINKNCELYEPKTVFGCFWANIMKDELLDYDLASDYIRDCKTSKMFVCDKDEYK
jgi:hypothetical protein